MVSIVHKDFNFSIHALLVLIYRLNQKISSIPRKGVRGSKILNRCSANNEIENFSENIQGINANRTFPVMLFSAAKDLELIASM